MNITKHRQYLVAASFPLALIITGIATGFGNRLLDGFSRILVSPSVLLHDYLSIGGFSATVLNAGILGALSVILLWVLKITITGPYIAALYTVIGFAFFGKNILNVWPILFGVWLFSRVQKNSFKNYVIVALFGTTLAPLVSALAFSGWVTGWQAWALAIGFGTAAGFVLPPLASHLLRFHDGYNIYNIGFTGGIIGSFLMALLRSFNFSIKAGSPMSTDYDFHIQLLLYFFFSLCILTGILKSRRDLKGLKEAFGKIHASSGRLVSDFTTIGNYPASLINMGIMGFVSSGFVLVLGGNFNGPVVGGILTVVGFAAFGKHIKNCLPILVGVILAAQLKIWEIGATPVIIAGLFGTTLAPVAGQFGPVAGILAGFFHLSIVHNVGILHGGINLYNNGFAGGFVASFLVPIINALQKKEKPA